MQRDDWNFKCCYLNSERNITFKKAINYESRNIKAEGAKLGTSQNPTIISRELLLSRESVSKKRNKNIVVFA